MAFTAPRLRSNASLFQRILRTESVLSQRSAPHPNSGIPNFPLPKTLFMARGYRHVQNFGHHIMPGGPLSSKLLRDFGFIREVYPYQVWIRSSPSDSGDLVDAVVPFMGESITDGTLATFLKNPGDRVEVDETIAQVETDKVTIDVASPEAGLIEKFIAKEGDTVVPGMKIAVIAESDSSATHAQPGTKPEKDASEPTPAENKTVDKEVSKVEVAVKEVEPKKPSHSPSKAKGTEPQLPPMERERQVPMEKQRKRMATRLKDSQSTYVMVTTSNEVDMTNWDKIWFEYDVTCLPRKAWGEVGPYVCICESAGTALQNQPIINAVIDGEDIIYREYIDISIAVGTSKIKWTLLRMIEKAIDTFKKRANNGSLTIDEMAGGTFTISNGGIYGSLSSTPIINPPQSAILGMHKTQTRPMVVGENSDIVPRQMMNIVLTYDHRLTSGREAATLLAPNQGSCGRPA